MKTATCTCGKQLKAPDEDDLVRQMHDHAKQQHGKEMSREQILEIARDG